MELTSSEIVDCENTLNGFRVKINKKVANKLLLKDVFFIMQRKTNFQKKLD